MRKSSKIIALLVTLVMLVCALAVAINASTELPSVTVPDKTNSYDLKALEQQIFEDEDVYYRYNSAAQLTYTGNDIASRYLGFEGFAPYRVDSSMDVETVRANVPKLNTSDDNKFFEYKMDEEQTRGDGVIEITGTETNHYLRFSGTKAGNGTVSMFRYNVAGSIVVASSSTNSANAFRVYDYDFTSDKYVKDGGGLTTDIAEAENGGKLAYSEFNSICFLLEGSGKYGKIAVSFEYDESSNTWYACYGEGKLPVRNELGAWNHITIVCVPYSLSSTPGASDVVLTTYAYLDGDYIGSDLPYGGEALTHNAYPDCLAFYDDMNPYTADDMSLCLDNLAISRYGRHGVGSPSATELENKTCKITYADLFTRDANQVHPETLNGTIPAIVSGWGSAGAPSDGREGKLSYAVYSDSYTYPEGTTYAATITRDTVVDGFYAMNQAVANLQEGDTLTIKSGLTLNYKGSVSFTAVCDEGAITLPRDSEMALVRTADGYKVVPQSDVAEATTITLFPTYEDYEAATREEECNSHDFTIIQGAPLDPEDADGNNYPDYIEWIVLDSETSVIAEGLSATDLATADMIANAAFIYPAPKADITVNWYTSKDAVTPFATATYKNGETIVAPDTTGVEGLDGKVPFNKYIDMIFGGTFVDAEGNAFVAGTTASANVNYYAEFDTPQIKADYASKAYMNVRLATRWMIVQVYAPITNEEGVKWSNLSTEDIGGKTYGLMSNDAKYPYSNFNHGVVGDKTVTVTVNGKTSAPVKISVPSLITYFNYVLEHKDAYTALERQLILDLVQYNALFMAAETGRGNEFVGAVYNKYKTECTDISKLSFEGDKKYQPLENAPEGVLGATLIKFGSGAYTFWSFALAIEDDFDYYWTGIEIPTWDADGNLVVDANKTLWMNKSVVIDGVKYCYCQDNQDYQTLTTITNDITFRIGNPAVEEVVRFNYNLATHIQNAEAAEQDASLARAMYALSKSAYAYITATVD